MSTPINLMLGQTLPTVPTPARKALADAAAVVAEAQAVPALPEARPEPAAEARSLQARLDELTVSAVSLRFRVDEDAGRIVVQMVDADTGDVIRQVPGEDALKMAREMAERAAMARGER